MKKIIRVLGVIAMLGISVAMLSAGGNKQASGGQTAGKRNVTLMTWGNTQNEGKTTAAVLKAYPDLAGRMDIEVIIGGNNSPEVANALRLALAANDNIPDIVMLNYANMPEFASAGVLADISSIMKPFENDLFPGVRDSMQYRGKYVAFPYDAKPKYWFYRKDMFNSAGIDVNKIKTIDDFIAAGRQLKSKYPGSCIWNIGATTFQADVEFTLTALGAKFYGADGKYIINTDPGVRKTFEIMKKLKDSGVVGNFKTLEPDWEKAIKDDVLASALLASWFKVFAPNIAPNQAGKWDVTLWPEEIQKGGNAAIFVVPDKAKNRDLALEFLSKMRFEKTGSIAVFSSLGLSPVLKSCVTAPEFSAPDPYFGFSMTQKDFVAFENFSVFPATDVTGAEFRILFQYLDEYLNGAISLENALANAQNDMVNTIQNLR